jgi:adenylate cyclase
MLYRGDERERGFTLTPPLFVGESLAQVATWSVFNGLFHPHVVVSVTSKRSEYNLIDTRELLDKLHTLFKGHEAPTIDERVFLAPPKVERLLISVSPLSFEEERSGNYASHGWDILNYGQQRRSQLRDISVVTQNSWGELFCRRYQGEEAFTQAMRSLFAEGGSRIQLTSPPEVLGPNSRVQPVVRKRVLEVLTQATRVFSDEGEGTKIYTYEVGGQFQILHKGSDGARINTVRTLRGVIRRCSHLSPEPQELLIDQLSPSLQEVRALVTRFREDKNALIYVGWKQTDRLGYVVVCDERERLFFQQSSARETRLAVVRIVRRALPYLKRRVSTAKDLRQALRIFELSEGHISGGKGLIFTEATSNVLTALTKASGQSADGLWLVGRFDEGRAGLGLRYGKQEFMASRYGASFVYACVKHIVETHGLQDPETWTLDGSKVEFGPSYGELGPGAVQHLRLINIYQKAITSALNYILQNQFALAQ